MSQCVGVFGLSLYTTERELEKEFSRFGPLEKVQVVLDGKVSFESLGTHLIGHRDEAILPDYELKTTMISLLKHLKLPESSD